MKKTALLSVFDKRGIVELAAALQKMDWEIISTGGTSLTLKNAGINHKQVDEITGFPEILDGRVKTLHPLIHGGILYRRTNPEDRETVSRMDIHSIDMVVNTLYPFETIVKKAGVTKEEILENIDIGGPAMIRAAAKNYRDVIIVTDPDEYNWIIEELKGHGDLSINNRQKLASKAFARTASYDSLISNYFHTLEGELLPTEITLPFTLQQVLRYGENPHQQAAFYKERSNDKNLADEMIQLQGKEMSYNNLNDIYGALKMIKEFQEPTAVAVKHANPCGIASGQTLLEAFQKAYDCDQVSIYGGILAFNRVLDEETTNLLKNIFLEIIIAPGFEEKSLELLKSKTNLRLVSIRNLLSTKLNQLEIKQVAGGILIQERDNELLPDKCLVVTNEKPSENEWKDLIFAWKAVKHVNSNGIVIARNQATIGIGQGEVRRAWAVEKALQRADNKCQSAVMASDGFFFPDTIELMAKYGIRCVIQPGGSIQDQDVIRAADDQGIAMVFTGMRHFKH